RARAGVRRVARHRAGDARRRSGVVPLGGALRVVPGGADVGSARARIRAVARAVARVDADPEALVVAQRRFGPLIVTVFVALFVLVARLFQVQIVEGRTWSREADNLVRSRQSLPGERGKILDR